MVHHPLYKAQQQALQIKNSTLLYNLKYNFQHYGFNVNLLLTPKTNAQQILLNMPLHTYFNRAKNTSFHNLCTIHSPPPGTNLTLGKLGLKFCIKRNFIPTTRHTLARLKRDIRTKYMMRNKKNHLYEPKIYIPIKDVDPLWEPTYASLQIETNLLSFTDAYRE